MKPWHYLLAIVLLLGTAAALIAPWRQQPPAKVERVSSAWPPPAPHQTEPRICRRADAVEVFGDELSENNPTPELSVRTDSPMGRTLPISVQLIVDSDGSVICAEAIGGFPAYRKQAE